MGLGKRKKWLLIAAGILAGLCLISFVVVSLQVREAFAGKKWRLPSTVYARPLELFVGQRLNASHLVKELKELGYIQTAVVKKPGQYARRGGRFILHKRAFRFWDGVSEAQRFTLSHRDGVVTSLEAADQQIAVIRLEPMVMGGIYPHDFEDRKLVKLDQIPQHLIDALLAVEDQGFYSHWGLSPTGIIRAIRQNLISGRYAQGASTLTQQLVKNFFLTPERSLKRKILEALYAFSLEVFYSKEEILETYMNEIYLGQSGARAVHGFGLAAEFYFGKALDQLNIEESALLVAIVNGPSLYNPRNQPKKARARRDLVLKVMAQQELLSPTQLSELLQKPLGVAKTESSETLKYPAYLDLVKRHLARDYAAEDLQEEGLKIFTAFDPSVQWQVEKSIQRRVKAWGSVGKQFEAAAIVGTVGGDIEAIAGSAELGVAGFNRALDARRPIGSLVKPAIALAALQSDLGLHLTSKISDEPIEITTDDGKVWRPANYDRKSHGEVPLFEALAKSYNQAFVRLGMEVGPEAVAQVFYDLGIEEQIPHNPAMLLGSFGLSPLAVLQMYQSLASDGFVARPRTVRYLIDSSGEPAKSYDIELKPSIPQRYLNLVQFALQVVMFEGTGRGAYRSLPKDFYAAGKTGTSNDRRDSWFAGFTGDKVSVVWLGRDDNKPTPLTGSTGALPIWADIMREVSTQPLDYQQVAGVNYHWVDEQTGALSKQYCQGVRQIPFIAGTEPTEFATCIKSAEPIVDWFRGIFGRKKPNTEEGRE